MHGIDYNHYQKIDSESRLQDRSLLFCYAHARTPHDAILPLWIRQVSKACDGWAVFSWKDDLALGIIGAYTKRLEVTAWEHENQAVFMSAWSHFNSTGAMKKYDWFLHLDIDTFVVPSRLRTAFQQYSAEAGQIITQGKDTDGFFVAIPRQKLQSMWLLFLERPKCLHHVPFEFLSGHVNKAYTRRQNCEEVTDRMWKLGNVIMLADLDGDALVAAFSHCEELHDWDALLSNAVSPKQRWCGQMNNTLLSCFESARDCERRKVLAGKCGRKLKDGVCVSSHFVAVHPVKSYEDFQRFVDAFP
eukprot:TRINITY_DN3103_c2_g1_i1.p1 TRINITY_DN3103_c2_g1~~TRINITY_DN3103_c2_g1_i1.p1  ORF type:complete len:336 (+),score=33.51 TRINITY_DN3103_c2_g1_i1:105-1010(+)